jgi:putative ABC transport system ATP-binding protein
MNSRRPPVIELRNVSKVYRMGALTLQVLFGIDVTVEQNEFVAIMGPSGSGKSTLMNILGALDQPTSGEYLFDNQNISGLDDDALSRIRNRRIGFVFQNFSLLPRMTARENVEVPLVYAGMSLRDRHNRSERMLEKVGLGARGHHRPNEMSGGEKQRVAIARALVNQPSVILADEPTGNLDSRTSHEIMEIMTELEKEGHTIILVTHEEDIAAYAHRKITLRDGRIEDDVKIKS